MEWFTWLSKSGLDQSLVYEYGMSFSHNELEQEDIAYFNHEFLQSMGISIAKHRLEILKLAKKETRLSTTRNHEDHKQRLIYAMKKTKKCLIKCLRTLVRFSPEGSENREERSALMVVPQMNHGYVSKLRGAMLKRNGDKLVVAKQGRLMITNGSFSSRRVNSFSSPVVFNLIKNVEDIDHHHHDNHDDHDDNHDQDGYWSNAVEDIRWDTLFQDLKPT